MLATIRVRLATIGRCLATIPDWLATIGRCLATIRDRLVTIRPNLTKNGKAPAFHW